MRANINMVNLSSFAIPLKLISFICPSNELFLMFHTLFAFKQPYFPSHIYVCITTNQRGSCPILCAQGYDFTICYHILLP